jgi:hypothetical protein
MRTKTMVKWIIERLKEPSTFAGLAGLAGAYGIAQPLYQASVAVVMAVAGLAAVLMADKPKA